MPANTTATVITVTKLGWYLWIWTIFAYLNIPDTQLYILSVLMTIDFIFWVTRQFVLDRSEITSYKAWLGLFKKVSTLWLVLSMGLMFKWINLDGRDYIEWILWIFIMAEFYSIVRSVYAIRTGKMLPEYDVISLTIKKLWDYIIKLIDKK